MSGELPNLFLLGQLIFKVGIYCGFGPGIVIACALSTRGKNFFWSPISVGKLYRVEGHYLGEFVCEVRELDRDNAQVVVTDPMRSMPRVRNRCCFPECVRNDFHGGDHEFVRVRAGVTMEVSWRLAKWIPVAEQFSGRAVSHSENRASEVPAISPPRKERRYA